MAAQLLGEPVEFWCQVLSVMRKARIDSPEQLAQMLSPRYEVTENVLKGGFVIREVRQNCDRVVCWTDNKSDADLIAKLLGAA